MYRKLLKVTGVSESILPWSGVSLLGSDVAVLMLAHKSIGIDGAPEVRLAIKAKTTARSGVFIFERAIMSTKLDMICRIWV